MLFTCNHHGANTCVVLHAASSTKPIVVTAADSDILVLLIHVNRRCQNAKQWQIKINPRIFIDIKTICNFS